MLKYNITDSGVVSASETTVVDGVLSSFTNIITGNPSTRVQSIVLGGTMFGVGVLTSALVFSRDKEKYSWFDKLSQETENV